MKTLTLDQLKEYRAEMHAGLTAAVKQRDLSNLVVERMSGSVAGLDTLIQRIEAAPAPATTQPPADAAPKA